MTHRPPIGAILEIAALRQTRRTHPIIARHLRLFASLLCHTLAYSGEDVSETANDFDIGEYGTVTFVESSAERLARALVGS